MLNAVNTSFHQQAVVYLDHHIYLNRSCHIYSNKKKMRSVFSYFFNKN